MSKEIISHAEFARLVNVEGGASRTYRSKEKVTGPGVMVSKKGTEKKSAPPLTTSQAKEYYEEHVGEEGTQSAHGGWKDKHTVYQDTSRKYSDLNKARKAGEKHNQIAGYDLGGTDTARPEGGNIYFDRSVPGIESDPEWQSTKEKTGKAERLTPTPKRGEREEMAHINRQSRRRNKRGQTVPVTINEVLGTIASNRRKRREGKL